MLHHGVLHVLQALDGVDALPPVLADVGQRALDVLDVHQGVVQLGEPRAHPVQLGLDGGLEAREETGNKGYKGVSERYVEQDLKTIEDLEKKEKIIL